MVYSTKHWNRRIPEYLQADWSSRPTPFAQAASRYFPSHARILELGAGAGQDSLWFAAQGFEVVVSDASPVGFAAIKSRARRLNLETEIIQLDVTQPFKLADASFDVIYAQLVLHYFDDKTLQSIIKEIQRVLKPGGIFACMVNSVKDIEYNVSAPEESDLIQVGSLMKRYFTKESFAPFVEQFETMLFDGKGQTPKDDTVDNSGMIRFIGRKQ